MSSHSLFFTLNQVFNCFVCDGLAEMKSSEAEVSHMKQQQEAQAASVAAGIK